MSRTEVILKDWESLSGHHWSLRVSGRLIPGSEPFTRFGECLCPGRGPSVEDLRIEEVYEVADFGLIDDQGFPLRFAEVDDGEKKLIAYLHRSEHDMADLGEVFLHKLAGERK